MDLEFLNDVKNNQNKFHDLNFDFCPKCRLMSYAGGLCQSCGFNANISKLGPTLGEKSFYSLKENFLLSLSDFEREHPKLFKDDSKYKLFINKVKLRYNDLLDYFYSSSIQKNEDYKIHVHELRDVVIELMNSGIDESEIWAPLENFPEDETLFTKIKLAIIEHQEIEKKSKESLIFKKLSLDYKFGGIISIGALLLVFITLIVLISLSISFISYYRFNV